MDNIFDRDTGSTARQAVTGLAKLGMVMKNEAWHAAAGRGISPTQGQVLALLKTRQRGLRLQEIARDLAITAATASDSVSALEAKGLVIKGPDETDPRARQITLTSAGEAEAGLAMAWPDFLIEAVDELPSDEQAVLLKLLVKMVRSLQEQGRIPVQRMCLGCEYFTPNRYANQDAPHHCGYVDAPFGDAGLRLDCPDFSAAPAAKAETAWQHFVTAP